MKKFARSLAGVGIGLVAFLVLAAGTAVAHETPGAAIEAPTATPAEQAAPEVVEMVVGGLSCPFCAYGLEKRMNRLEGLSALEIEPESGVVTVRLEGVDRVAPDPETGRPAFVLEDGTTVTEERIRELVNEAGFTVKRFQRAPWVDEAESAG